MSTTYLELARLGRASAALLAAGRASGRLSDPTQAQAALVCRDTVTVELRSLTRAVLRIGAAADGLPAPRPELTLLTTSPAHALHAALDTLPPATGRDLPLTQALTVPGGPLLTAWQDAARAAAALERHHDSAAELSGTDAWQVLRDVADLSAAVGHLDSDLAAALPPGHPREHARLLDAPGHTLTRLAADQLRAQTADLHGTRATGPGSTGPSSDGPPGPRQPHSSAAEARDPREIRTLGDLPEATARITALVHARGADLTSREVAAVSRLLSDGLAVTSRVLAATSPPGSPDHDLALALQRAVSPLQHLAAPQLATLTPTSPGLLELSNRVRDRLRAVTALTDRLAREPASAPDLARLAQPLTLWASHAPAAAAAVQRGLRLAEYSNRLVAPRTDNSRGRHETLLWLPLHRTHTPNPTLAAAERSATQLAAAAAPLTAHARARAGQPAASSSGNAPPGVSRAARADTPALPSALAQRAPAVTTGAARRSHPAVPAGLASSSSSTSGASVGRRRH